MYIYVIYNILTYIHIYIYIYIYIYIIYNILIYIYTYIYIYIIKQEKIQLIYYQMVLYKIKNLLLIKGI